MEEDKNEIMIVKWSKSDVHNFNNWDVYDGKGNNQNITITLDMIHKMGCKILSQSSTESIEGLSVTTFVILLPSEKEIEKMKKSKKKGKNKGNAVFIKRVRNKSTY